MKRLIVLSALCFGIGVNVAFANNDYWLCVAPSGDTSQTMWLSDVFHYGNNDAPSHEKINHAWIGYLGGSQNANINARATHCDTYGSPEEAQSNKAAYTKGNQNSGWKTVDTHWVYREDQ
jgi:hypothetical protein